MQGTPFTNGNLLVHCMRKDPTPRETWATRNVGEHWLAGGISPPSLNWEGTNTGMTPADTCAHGQLSVTFIPAPPQSVLGPRPRAPPTLPNPAPPPPHGQGNPCVSGGTRAHGRDARCPWALTALDGVGGHLQRQRAAAGLRDVDPEHQPHARVLPANVRLPLAQLDVRVPELQDPGTVDAARQNRRALACRAQPHVPPPTSARRLPPHLSRRAAP